MCSVAAPENESRRPDLDVSRRSPRPVEEPTGQEPASRKVHRRHGNQARLADQRAEPSSPNWKVKGHHPALGRQAMHGPGRARDISLQPLRSAGRPAGLLAPTLGLPRLPPHRLLVPARLVARPHAQGPRRGVGEHHAVDGFRPRNRRLVEGGLARCCISARAGEAPSSKTYAPAGRTVVSNGPSHATGPRSRLTVERGEDRCRRGPARARPPTRRRDPRRSESAAIISSAAVRPSGICPAGMPAGKRPGAPHRRRPAAPRSPRAAAPGPAASAVQPLRIHPGQARATRPVPGHLAPHRLGHLLSLGTPGTRVAIAGHLGQHLSEPDQRHRGLGHLLACARART